MNTAGTVRTMYVQCTYSWYNVRILYVQCRLGLRSNCARLLRFSHFPNIDKISAKFSPWTVCCIVKDLFWFTVQITQFQKSLITGFLMIEVDSHTHCEYTDCIFGMKMLFMVGGWGLFKTGGIDDQTIKSLEKMNIHEQTLRFYFHQHHILNSIYDMEW